MKCRALLSAQLLGAVVALAGCETPGAGVAPASSSPPAASASASTSPSAALTAHLPPKPGPFAPSEARVDLEHPPTGAELADVEACASCHVAVATQWRSSPHRFASFDNPIYRASVDRYREAVGRKESRFCAGCHDIALLVDGAMDDEVRPDDPRARAGVTCRVCHGIVDTRPGGNGSYTLSGRPIPPPVAGDAASLEAHRRAAKPRPIEMGTVCAGCHQAFLSKHTGHHHFLPGADDATPWRRSGYAGSPIKRVDRGVVEKTCVGCHMREEAAVGPEPAARRGRVSSHRVAGGHTWLAAMRGDDVQREKVERMLQESATIDIAVATPADTAPVAPAEGVTLRPGTRVVFDVVVSNVRVGHRFPGGTIDAQDTWLSVEVLDARERRIASAGTEHARTGADATAHRLRAEIVDADGQPLRARQVERFRAVAYDHTIGPRDAGVVQLALTVPPILESARPLSIRARLWHRSRPFELAKETCRASATPRGRSFDAGLNACAPQPVTLVAERHLVLASASDEHDEERLHRFTRLITHGRGMLHVVQERLDEARPSLEAALALAETGTAFDRTLVMSLLGSVSARQGRTDEALDWFERARVDGGTHPALARLSGNALAQVWKFEAALPLLELASQDAPLDDSNWARLAIALGSLHRDAEALEAAQRGLALQPRHPDLLRVQSLALRALGADSEVQERAHDAYLEHRVADDGPAVGALCAERVPGCAVERNPVHVHEMRVHR